MSYYHADGTTRRTDPITFCDGLRERTESIGYDGQLSGIKAFYTREGAKLAQQLFDTLPGGTFDALLVEMLDIKASLLRVGHWDGIKDVD